MAERPILFSAAMVRAILADKKTQTRRVVKPQPPNGCDRVTFMPLSTETTWRNDTTGEKFPSLRRADDDPWMRCPYGAPGDVLWVRESAYIAPPDFGDRNAADLIDDNGRPRVVGYAASMDADAVRCARDYGVKLTPSIHMPRWASRLTLRVTSVRVERLHAITPEDIVAEGVRVPVSRDGSVLVEITGKDSPMEFLAPKGPWTPEDHLRAQWASLWSRTYGRPSWDANPWVWVVGFERTEVSRG